jgi:exodeoxyribonuclease VII large subunit
VVAFRVVNTAVQGSSAAAEVIEAIGRLDADPAVEVIVVARGGGSVEDLLPFSDEALIRAVARARTPVVSAIGHEQDAPLLDLVADLRASTPTDAAKLVVPDVAEEADRIAAARARIRELVVGWVGREQSQLDALRSRPVLADPRGGLRARGEEVDELRRRAGQALANRLDHAADDLNHQVARVRALSPRATLERGYAVVQSEDGQVLTSVGATASGEPLTVRLSDGRLAVRVDDVQAQPEVETHD